MALKKDLEERIKGMALERVDLILTKEHRIAQYMASMKIDLERPIAIMVVESFDDLAFLDEKAMNAAGWFRKEEKKSKIISLA